MAQSKKLLSLVAIAATSLSLAACDSADRDPRAAAGMQVQQQFLATLASYCGQAFKGEVVSDQAIDDEWRQSEIIMHVRDCSEDEVRIPLHVGDDRSRTWVVSRTDSGLELQHIHRHEDGTEDDVSPYGGHTAEAGTASSQDFVVDELSRELFAENDLIDSRENTWTMSVMDGDTFSYALTRTDRNFEVQFDLTDPVEEPPAAWGYEGDDE